MVGVNLRGRRCPDPVHRLVLKPIQRLVAHLAHGMLEGDTISEQNKEEQGEEGLGQKSRRHHDGARGITCKWKGGFVEKKQPVVRIHPEFLNGECRIRMPERTRTRQFEDIDSGKLASRK